MSYWWPFNEFTRSTTLRLRRCCKKRAAMTSEAQQSANLGNCPPTSFKRSCLPRLRSSGSNCSRPERRVRSLLPEARWPLTGKRPWAGHRLLASSKKCGADDAATDDDTSCSRKRLGPSGGVELKRYKRCHFFLSSETAPSPAGVARSSVACDVFVGDDSFEPRQNSESGCQDKPQAEFPSVSNLDGFMAEVMDATYFEL